MNAYRASGRFVCDEDDLLEVFYRKDVACIAISASINLEVVFQADDDKIAETLMSETLSGGIRSDINGTFTLERGVLISNHFQAVEMVRQIKLTKKS